MSTIRHVKLTHRIAAIGLSLAAGLAQGADAPGGPAANPSAIPRCPAPQYPQDARRFEVEGRTRIAVEIDRNGQVTATAVAESSGRTSEHASLDTAALATAKQCRFSPAGGATSFQAPFKSKIEFVWKLDEAPADPQEPQVAKPRCPAREYPLSALRFGARGVTWLSVDVDTNGMVTAVIIDRSSGPTSEHAALDALAATNAWKCRFTPLKGASTFQAPFRRKLDFVWRLGSAEAPTDAPQNMAEIRAAAEQGDSTAMAGVAYAQLSGREPSIPRDQVKGREMARRSAELGNPQGQFVYADSLENGAGGTRSIPEAVAWYRKSAELGSIASQLRLAKLYRDGIGVKADDAESRHWYRVAAAQGEVSALQVLADYHLHAGPDYQPSLAWIYLTIATRRGHADSRSRLADVSPQIDETTRQRAEALSQRWTPGQTLPTKADLAAAASASAASAP